MNCAFPDSLPDSQFHQEVCLDIVSKFERMIAVHLKAQLFVETYRRDIIFPNAELDMPAPV